MNKRCHRASIATVFFFVISAGGLSAKNFLTYINEEADFKAAFSVRFRPEFFWSKNANLLNNSNPHDLAVYARHVLDLDLYTGYGEKKCGWDIIEFKTTLRDRAIWGCPTSIAKTTESKFKLSKTLTGSHKHDLPRHILWLREIWLRMDLAQALGLTLSTYHDFTVGSFPFELGRGIALGSAYAVGPDRIGFYSDSIVDQYAYGARIYGEIVETVISYDLYAAILQNKCTNFAETTEEICSQEFGKRHFPHRGVGKINYVLATRVNLKAFDTPTLGILTLEPYALFNSDPEQKVEFPADASSKLGTAGLAGEYIGNCFEFGFDYAMNFGHQAVKGWDRNQMEIRGVNSYLREFNSQVLDQNGDKLPFAPDTTAGKEAQKIIENSPQGELYNGKQIGSVIGDVGGDINPTLFNSDRRFRDPFNIMFDGWMFVADGAWWVHNHEMMFAATAGVASGGDHPHEDTNDNNYTGFIPLQEVYAGKRVKSAFLMAGSSKIKRPLAISASNQAPSQFAIETNGFTNLIFTGGAMYWKPKNYSRDFGINPNMLFYWQEKPTKKFDLSNKQDTSEFARTFLGAEINMFLYCFLIKNLKGFFIGSMFIPGGFFYDVRGRPCDDGQMRDLAKWKFKSSHEGAPNIGTDPAFAINFGVEYVF